ncbi:hypothetical protein ACM0P6_08920 [Komagataeibacter sucrofermentans]|uniref:DUF4136 domain-containing protein n=1 Tax=Komagataeibacter sucrofermentans TaxID=1053551 RepID=A0A318QXU3_9PROT|nr:hypothetical protein [Komagataeibacter sucrofermentans]PYD80099.1 hypothetical protein CFR77_03745 [Komagataeibacter sucrofermentans]
MKSLPIALLALVCLWGCAHDRPVQTTIPAAMAGLETTLGQAGIVSVSHPADWSQPQAARFTAAIRAAQCRQHVADPVIGAIVGDVTLQLSGSFTHGGQFTVGALTTSPTFGLAADASRTTTQQVSLPVSYASLSSMPEVEMARQATYETTLLGQNDAIRHTEATRLLAGRDALRQITNGLIQSWRADDCAPAPQPLRPFATLRR